MNMTKYMPLLWSKHKYYDHSPLHDVKVPDYVCYFGLFSNISGRNYFFDNSISNRGDLIFNPFAFAINPMQSTIPNVLLNFDHSVYVMLIVISV